MSDELSSRDASPICLYGIKACDTMKKARTWLDEQGIAYRFLDYKKEGIDAERLNAWCNEHGWEKILNRQGTTFRKLADADKQDIDTDKAVALMQANPSMIKRPVLDIGSERLVGFKPELYARAFD
ncbi:ArsC family reductase [Pseudomonas sp. gcc21]|uniref:ArsC family reductase n=1 Tax=Pseudomonas sp. gcc21 TaxID=2726989 RepID=UPI0021150F82|nr:ArsC family reductase [Pseudomonas sp. gcc21]